MTSVADSFKAILFDKDGTLFDFRGTWDRWAAAYLPSLCGDDQRVLEELAQALGFDLKNQGHAFVFKLDI